MLLQRSSIESLEKNIYMKQPQGFEERGQEDKVCKLKRSLYGLKQAGRVWSDKLKIALKEAKLSPIRSDECIFTNKEKSLFMITYVDDFLIASAKESDNMHILSTLQQQFKLKIIGEPVRFLGLKLTRDRKARTISLDLLEYTDDILIYMQMDKCKAASTPMVLGKQMVPKPDDDEHTDALYQRCIGSMMFMVTTMRPDLAYAVGSLAMFAAKPSHEHSVTLKYVLRYLQLTKDTKLVLGGTDTKLYGYTDASYGDLYNGKSTEGYIFYLGQHPITWASKKQKIVAISTTESEYIAATEAVKEAIWLKNMLNDFGIQQNKVTIYGDNRSTIALALNNEFHARTKHINIKHHFIRSMIQDGIVELVWVDTKDNIADIMTKALTKDLFTRFKDKIYTKI